MSTWQEKKLQLIPTGANPDDYLFLLISDIKPIPVMIKSEVSILYLREYCLQILQEKDDRELLDVIITLDKEGKISLGNKFETLKSTGIRDGTNIDISYLLFKSKHGKNWFSIVPPKTLPDHCTLCKSKATKYIAFGILLGKICGNCLTTSLSLDSKESVSRQLERGVRTFECNICNRSGAGTLWISQLFTYTLRCPGFCGYTILRDCDRCDIPTDQFSRIVDNGYYCSPRCQSLDKEQKARSIIYQLD